MNYEMTVYIGDACHKLFIQNGFFDHKRVTENLHNHRYGEIHIQFSGEAVYAIGNENITLKGGDALLIPPKTFHKCISNRTGSTHCAFQADIASDKIKVNKYPTELFREIEQCICAGEDKRAELAAYLSVICCGFDEYAKKSMPMIQDKKFIVSEFLDNNYSRDIRLSDLAAELGISEKQSGRIVKEITGRSFRDELTRKRMEAAHSLLGSGMSLYDISAAVGYKSYSGFWKAYNSRKK